MEDFLETLESEYPGLEGEHCIPYDCNDGAIVACYSHEYFATSAFWRLIGIDCADRLVISGTALIKHLMFAKRYGEVEALASGDGLRGLVDAFLNAQEEDFDFDPDMSDVEGEA